MGRECRGIQNLTLIHKLAIISVMFLIIVRHLYSKYVAQRNRGHRYSVTGRMHAQINHLHRIVEVGDAQCVVNLRMDRNSFAHLCYLVTHVGGLVESRYVRIEEKLAMFLSILAHHKKSRIIGHDYIRSGHTISTHFHEVLRSVLKLHFILLVKPIPVEEETSNDTWKWFKGCLGALDGTYINVHVPNKEKPKYRTRKGATTVNVLGVCDRNMKFIYALTGWEGSAADARVLRDAIGRPNGLKIPRGCYYLCDNGYGNVEGFLTPYRRTRYHLHDWVNGSRGPQNYKEYFNSKHCKARNVIERTFGLLKRRWAILRSPSFYPLKVQNRIIMACILLHNFVRSEMPKDPLEGVDESDLENSADMDDDFIDSVESSLAWDAWRDNLVLSMYSNN